MSISINGSSSAYSMHQQMQKAAKATAQQSASSQAANGTGTTRTNWSGGGNGYYGYLSDNYDCVRNGKVSISPTYLRACADDPAKAKELEENLSVFKDCYDSGLRTAQSMGKVIAYDHNWSFDANGELTMSSSVTIEKEGNGKSLDEFLEELEEEEEKKAEQDKRTGKTEVKEEIEKTFMEKSESSTLEVNVKVDIQYADKDLIDVGANQGSIDISA